MCKKCFKCGTEQEEFEMHPAIYDPIKRSWLKDKDGYIVQDISSPKIKVPLCKKCGVIFL